MATKQDKSELSEIKDLLSSMNATFVRIADALEALVAGDNNTHFSAAEAGIIAEAQCQDPNSRTVIKAESTLPLDKLATSHLLKLFEISPTYRIYDELSTRRMNGKLTSDQVKLFKQILNDLHG